MGEPLYLDVVAALKGSKFDAVPIYTGRYGTWFQGHNTCSDRCCISQ